MTICGPCNLGNCSGGIPCYEPKTCLCQECHEGRVEAPLLLYPECDKLQAVEREHRAIREFLESMQVTYDIYIGTEASIEHMVMAFFKIDSAKLEEERRALVESL